MEIRKWAFVIITALIFILSDALSADWGKNNHSASLIALFLVPPIGYIFFGYLNKQESLSVSSALVNILLLVGTILIGVFYFKDSLTLKQVIGLFFAFVAIVLLD